MPSQDSWLVTIPGNPREGEWEKSQHSFLQLFPLASQILIIFFLHHYMRFPTPLTGTSAGLSGSPGGCEFLVTMPLSGRGCCFYSQLYQGIGTHKMPWST